MSHLLKTAVAIGALLIGSETAQAAAKPSDSPGCVWIGKRIVQSLVRDDIVAANDYNHMYRTMDCSDTKLAKVFSCTVEKIGETDSPDTAGQTVSPTDRANTTTSFMNECWDGPLAKPVKPPVPKPQP